MRSRPTCARWKRRCGCPMSSSAWSAKGGGETPDMVRSMGDNPVIFAHGPIPTPRSPRRKRRMAVREDAIVATGRSDYPNQVNNVAGVPLPCFRGALDIHARAINDEMKIACAECAGRAGARGCAGRGWRWPMAATCPSGATTIIPAPCDPRLILPPFRPPLEAGPGWIRAHPRRAADDQSIWTAMRRVARPRDGPDSSILQGIYARAKSAQARMISAEGGRRAASLRWRWPPHQPPGWARALVVPPGREADVRAKSMEGAGLG